MLRVHFGTWKELDKFLSSGLAQVYFFRNYSVGIHPLERLLFTIISCLSPFSLALRHLDTEQNLSCLNEIVLLAIINVRFDSR